MAKAGHLLPRDSNVGGRLGDVLGQKLAALGQTHQVICVTHLPQVASYARHHWTIRKTKTKGRTVTLITAPSADDRQDAAGLDDGRPPIGAEGDLALLENLQLQRLLDLDPVDLQVL